jgi:hypothetical protein
MESARIFGYGKSLDHDADVEDAATRDDIVDDSSSRSVQSPRLVSNVTPLSLFTSVVFAMRLSIQFLALKLAMSQTQVSTAMLLLQNFA